MKKLKIPGITGFPPLFLTRLNGMRDAKHGSVAFLDGTWIGGYLDAKIKTYSAFIAMVYLNLEQRTSPLFIESAKLMVEYQELLQEETSPPTTPSGRTASLQARNAAADAARVRNNFIRKREIERRLPEIDESIAYLVNVAHEESVQARELTARRLYAYLHGASRTVHKPVTVPFSFSAVEEEEVNFNSRHQQNDARRKELIRQVMLKEEASK